MIPAVKAYLVWARDLSNEYDVSDKELLRAFRCCADCKKEIISRQNQMQAILEFESPAAAHKAIEACSDHECR